MGVMIRIGEIFGTRREAIGAPALTAAAERVKLESKSQAAKNVRRTQDWQKRAWDYLDTVPEVSYATMFLGNACSRLRLYVGEVKDPEQDPEQATDPTALDALDRIRSPAAGHSSMLRKLAENLSISGEAYLLGLTDPPPEGAQPPIAPAGEGEPPNPQDLERWEIRSVDEVQRRPDGTTMLRDEEGSQASMAGRVLTGDDYLLRIWVQSPRFTARAWSPMRAVMDVCEELMILEKGIRAAGRSRAAGAGVLFVPEEITLNGQPNQTFDEGEALPGSAADDPIMASIMAHLVAPLADEADPAAIAPILIRAKGELLDKVKHLTFDRPLDKLTDQRTERAIKRLANGLNVPAEVILGMADLNHWTAWQVDDNTFKAHVEPLALLICEALTTGYLHPALELAGVQDFRRFVVWYDATKLVVRPNRTEDAKDAHKANVISDEALRQYLGFGEDDAPSDEEILRRVSAQRGAIGDVLMVALLKALMPDVDLGPIDVSGGNGNGSPALPAGDGQPADGGDGGDTTPEQDQGDGQASVRRLRAAANAETGDLDWVAQDLHAIDRALRDRLQAAADGALERALERAGGKLRSKARKDPTLANMLVGVENRRVAKILGPSLVAAVQTDEQLLDGAFDVLGARFDRLVSSSQARALDFVPGMTSQQRGIAEDRQQEDREDAWAWLQQELLDLTRARLYDPSPDAPAQGEFDDTSSVPYGLVRQAVARAGGAAGPDAGAITAALLGDIFKSALGVATGWLMRRLLKDHGIGTKGYEWEYGAFPRSQPFQPHEDLDGVEFVNFDDEVLRNPEPFPPVEFYAPGDHGGCICDAIPKLVRL